MKTVNVRLPQDWFQQHAFVVAYNPTNKRIEVHGMGEYFIKEETEVFPDTELLNSWDINNLEEFYQYIRDEMINKDFILWCENPDEWREKQVR